VERSDTSQAAKHGRDHGLLLLLFVAVLAAYAITGFGAYSLIHAIV
jgi:hypothetical protein